MQHDQAGALLDLLQHLELGTRRQGGEIPIMAKDNRIVGVRTQQAQQLSQLFGLLDAGDRAGVHVALA